MPGPRYEGPGGHQSCENPRQLISESLPKRNKYLAKSGFLRLLERFFCLVTLIHPSHRHPQLNARDPQEKYHIIRLKETFGFHEHGCLVFMSGGPTLLACLTATGYRGLSSLEAVHNYTVQLLIAIQYMHHSGWVHTDLKPDNILTDW